MTLWAADTSVVIPLVVASHEAHVEVRRAVGDRALQLPAHAALESFSVLTRLPGDARLAPLDAATLLSARFTVVAPMEEVALGLVDRLGRLGIAGGAVYDALIAATATSVGATLLSRDRRAVATYSQLGTTVELLP